MLVIPGYFLVQAASWRADRARRERGLPDREQLLPVVALASVQPCRS